MKAVPEVAHSLVTQYGKKESRKFSFLFFNSLKNVLLTDFSKNIPVASFVKRHFS